MSDVIRSIPCPASEFGLEPCEENIHQSAYTSYGGYFDPPEFVVQEELEPICDCGTRASNESEYWDRVFRLLDEQEWEPDTSEPNY